MSENDCMFINLETNKGTLQLTVYNQHNGYYEHSVRILKNKTNMFGDDLYGANLRGANLSGANLDDADLWKTKLSGAKNIK